MDVLFTIAGIAVGLILLVGLGATLLTRKDYSPERLERKRRRQQA